MVHEWFYASPIKPIKFLHFRSALFLLMVVQYNETLKTSDTWKYLPGVKLCNVHFIVHGQNLIPKKLGQMG